jgi:NAD(P)-dependent dehydrogenase (short-subunit alcohol dehydrogenase family)
MDLGLRGKVALVSGSSDGIGYAVARSVAQEGARIVLCARREALLAEARQTIEKETGAEVLAVPCDVQRLADVQRLVGEIMQRFGVIHILVNNAGSAKSLSLQYAEDGILVTTVAPGSIETPRQLRNRQREADITGKTLDDLRKARVRDIPLHRLGRAEEVANVVVFLASERSSYMTGTCVTVDGGVVRRI